MEDSDPTPGPQPTDGRDDSPESRKGPADHRDETSDGHDAPLPSTATRSSHLTGYLVGYSALRLALVAVLTAILMIFMPLIVALLFAIIIQLPLAWLLFAGPRRRVNEALAAASAQRRAERARLESALSGDEPAA